MGPEREMAKKRWEAHLRADAELGRRLERAAAKARRSINQEILYRLDLTFEQEKETAF